MAIKYTKVLLRIVFIFRLICKITTIIHQKACKAKKVSVVSVATNRLKKL
jgi:hypothetical protein